MAEQDEVRIGDGPIRFSYAYRDLLSDQGIGINVWADVDDNEVEVLRFDCFDHEPHYHYGPEKRNERLMLDKTTEGDSLEWTLGLLRERLQRGTHQSCRIFQCRTCRLWWRWIR